MNIVLLVIFGSEALILSGWVVCVLVKDLIPVFQAVQCCKGKNRRTE